MDIQKEIQMYKELGYKNLLNELSVQEEELRMKQYLFKVLEHLNKLDKLIKDNVFSNENVDYMELEQTFDHDIGVIFLIEILDKNKEEISRYKGSKYCTSYEKLNNLFSGDEFKLEEDLFNKDILTKTIRVKLDETAKEVLKEILLNSDLVKAFNYIETLNKIPEKENKNKNKNKRSIKI